MTDVDSYAYADQRLARYADDALRHYSSKSAFHALLAAHEILIDLLVPTVPPYAAEALLDVIASEQAEGNPAAVAQMVLLLQRAENENAQGPQLKADSVSETEAEQLISPAQMLCLLLMKAGYGNAVSKIGAVLRGDRRGAAKMANMVYDSCMDEILG